MSKNLLDHIKDFYEIKRAIFLDRDGIINKDKGYVYKIKDFEFVDGIFEVCSYFQNQGYLIIVVTNQSGIARNYYSEDDYQKLNSWMIDKFKEKNITISKTYHCPHLPSENCDCRKPKPEMFLRAKNDFYIDMKHSILIGDKESDIKAGINAGIINNFLINKKDIIESKALKILNNLLEIKDMV